LKVSVIVPVFNEVASISTVILKIRKVVLPPDLQQEIIVVDDGSTDGSFEALSAQPQEGVLLLRLTQNSGKGFAIRAGLAKASGDFVLIQDADLEYDPNQHMSLLAPLLSGEAEAVYGSRFLGSIRGMQPANYLANKILSGMASLLFGATITDEATGLKAFRRELLQGLSLQCKRFEFCPEVTAKLLRQKIFIKEVPIAYEGRSTAQGKKIRWWDGVIAAYTLLRYRL
jgi:dolichol-phosphate mannosyltransferase